MLLVLHVRLYQPVLDLCKHNIGQFEITRIGGKGQSEPRSSRASSLGRGVMCGKLSL